MSCCPATALLCVPLTIDTYRSTKYIEDSSQPEAAHTSLSSGTAGEGETQLLHEMTATVATLSDGNQTLGHTVTYSFLPSEELG